MAEKTERQTLREAYLALVLARHNLNGFVEALAQTDFIKSLESLPQDEQEQAIETFSKKATYLRRAVTSVVQTTAKNMRLPALTRYAPDESGKKTS